MCKAPRAHRRQQCLALSWPTVVDVEVCTTEGVERCVASDDGARAKYEQKLGSYKKNERGPLGGWRCLVGVARFLLFGNFVSNVREERTSRSEKRGERACVRVMRVMRAGHQTKKLFKKLEKDVN